MYIDLPSRSCDIEKMIITYKLPQLEYRFLNDDGPGSTSTLLSKAK